MTGELILGAERISEEAAVMQREVDKLRALSNELNEKKLVHESLWRSIRAKIATICEDGGEVTIKPSLDRKVRVYTFKSGAIYQVDEVEYEYDPDTKPWTFTGDTCIPDVTSKNLLLFNTASNKGALLEYDPEQRLNFDMVTDEPDTDALEFFVKKTSFEVPEGALPGQFCRYHIQSADNPQGTDCSAHLAEGHVFKCNYDSPDEATNGQFIDGKRYNSVRCADFILRNYGPDCDFSC